MDQNCLQGLRFKLQRRVRRMNSAGFQTGHSVLKQLWAFVQGQPILVSILDDLARRCPEAKEDADLVLTGKGRTGETDLEHAAISLFVVRGCVAMDAASGQALPLLRAGHPFTTSTKYDDAQDAFVEMFVEPLYDYLDEHLDDQRAVLALLKRYKHRIEWFRRGQLLQLSKAGERPLAADLYEYLYDQGLDFAIEPTSASGKPDLISAQTGDDRLVADAKLFRPDAGKAYIAKAFHQIYQYCLDYNEPFGYLVVFKTCEEDLSFPLATQEQATPFLVHNNKTVFFVVIDIFQHEKTASQRGKLKTIEISEQELIEAAAD